MLILIIVCIRISIHENIPLKYVQKSLLLLIACSMSKLSILIFKIFWRGEAYPHTHMLCIPMCLPSYCDDIICDRISHNKASTHTKSNLRFYQKWIAGLIHYHIPHCTSFRTGKSGFCGSFLPTLLKPRVGDWCH